LDDRNDSDLKRNQLIAIVLMTVLVLVWFKWFLPVPPKQQPASSHPIQTETIDLSDETTAEQPEPTPAEDTEDTGLPAIPAIENSDEARAADEVLIADEHLELVFTRIGARLKRATVFVGKNGDDLVQLVPLGIDPDTGNVLPDTKVVYPLGLRFSQDEFGERFDWRRFEATVDPDLKGVLFSLTIPNKTVIRKRFSLGDKPRVLSIQIEYENLSGAGQILGMDETPAYFLNWGPNITTGEEETYGFRQLLMWRSENEITELATKKMKPSKTGEGFSKTIEAPEWVAMKSPYFVVAFKPEFDKAQGRATGSEKKFRFGLTVPRFEVAPGQTQSNAFLVYMGPCEQQSLGEAWETLPSVVRFFSPTWAFMDYFAKFLLGIMNWFYSYIPNYGLAIIFLTIVVRLAMYPLTLKSMKSMKKMQMLAPEMEELKKKYGDDQQEIQRKMMELYKERGVNPLGGCLPIMLQMPFFIALYRMLWNTYELRGAPFFLWITDLSQPDHLFHMPWMPTLPFVGSNFEYFNILPMLMAAAMVLNMKIMPVSGPAQNPQQKTMMMIMPVFMGVICYNMASGLNLYILTSTVLGMVQQKFTRVSDINEKPKKKTVGKGQHFYTAAKARQRQIAKEMKREKRQKKTQAGDTSHNKNKGSKKKRS